MEQIDFTTGAKLLAVCGERGISIAEAMQLREMSLSERSRDDIRAEMAKNLAIMRDSVRKGLVGNARSVSGLSGGDARKLLEYSMLKPFLGESASRATACTMAVVEVNAAMGRIVAAPTAGAAGILPGVLLSVSEERGWDDEMLIDGLFTAGAIGMLVATGASISGADGGCQAETGTGAAMCAGTLCALSGGRVEAVLDAAAIALKNVMGLVCDPVAGLVECPCIKRNAIGAANAMLSADLALCGVTSLIPFDEVVAAMKSVGNKMLPELRETALGGLAATPTAKAVAERVCRVQKGSSSC